MKAIWCKVIAAIIAVCIVVGIGGCIYMTTYNDHTYTITVTDKERVNTNNADNAVSKYLIFGTDENGDSKVFENTDSFLRFKFNGSDIYGEMEVGKTYEITVVGYRVPFFSAYENIVYIDEVS